MAIVTKPVILDETGKDIRDALDSASASILASITDGYNENLTLQEVVDARGAFTSLGQRLDSQAQKTNQLETELQSTLQDVEDYVDDAADRILADITDEFNIDGTLQEVVDARGEFVSLGQRLDNDDERLGVLEQTTRDLEYWKTTNNALPKVEGEGTEITLNNTADTVLDLDFKSSDITQETRTGKNKFNINQTPETDTTTVTKNNNVITQKNLSGQYYCYSSWVISNLTVGETYHINCNFVNSNGCTLRLNIYDNNDTLINRTDNTTSTSGTLSFTFTATSETIKMRLYSNNTTQPNTYTVVFSNIQLEQGNQATEYEPYGITPSPDIPSDIHVVKGDNEVVIENKNLFDYDKVVVEKRGNYQQATKVNKGYLGGWTYNLVLPKILSEGTYTFSYDIENNDALQYAVISAFDSEGNRIGNSVSLTNKKITITTNTDLEKIRFDYGQNTTTIFIKNMQLEKGNQTTTYVEHKEQRYSLSLGVENLFNKETAISALLNADGTTTSSPTLTTSDFIEVDSSKTYYKSISDSARVKFYDSSKNAISTSSYSDISDFGNARSFTIPYNNAKYIRFCMSNARVDTMQFEEGNQGHSYTPYGIEPIELCKIGNYQDLIFKNNPNSEYYDSTLELNKWYKLGRIGKVVLDGIENWNRITLPNTSLYAFYITRPTNSINTNNLLSNYFGGFRSYSDYDNTIRIDNNNLIISRVFYNISYIETVADFKNWLSTHNTVVYYPLETPTKNLLSDTLQDELDNIYYAMAYQDQTNISQENEDKPFIISASTVLDLKTLLTNMD